MTDASPSTDAPIIEGFALGPFSTNAFLLAPADGSDCWIIDAPFDPAPLIDAVRRRGLTPSRLLLTHAHADHIGGVEQIRSAFPGIRVLIHRAEAHWLNDIELNLSGGFGVPVRCHDAEDIIDADTTLTLGPDDWTITHTPGHSPGHIVIHSDTHRLAFVGDTLFAGSIGRTDFPTSDQNQLFESIRAVHYRWDEDTLILPGHGPTTTIGREKATNPFVRA